MPIDATLEGLINAIVDRLAADMRVSLNDLKEDMDKASKELGEQVEKGRALDDVIAIVKLDQVSADVSPKELLRKIREVLTGKELL